MTISGEDIFNAFRHRRRFCSAKHTMQRQESFDLPDDLQDGLIDKTTYSLPKDGSLKPNHDRSSLIFDWLADPVNQFMFQDGRIDGHVFRSNSAVQTLPLNNFIKNSLNLSMREAKPKIKDKSVNEDESMFSKEKADEKLIPDIEENLNQDTHACISKESMTNITDSECIADDLFVSEDVDCKTLTTKLKKFSLESDPMTKFYEDTSRGTSFSLPNFTKPKRQGKLRRINSDALFYKDTYRNNEKRRYSCIVKRRSLPSFKDSSDNCKSNHPRKTSSQPGNCIEVVNTENFINRIEEIVSRGDLQQVRELAECGFDFNGKDSLGNCALHYAALQGNEKMVVEILEHGGSVWMRNAQNQLPVELASNMNVRMLLSRMTLFYGEQYSRQTESHVVSKGMSFEL